MNPSDKTREAIVLAGGLGTRLAEAVPDIPKPLAPVAERPFLRFILDKLAESGFARVVLAVGYKHEMIEEVIGDNYRGMKILYSVEDQPLGTGGALTQAFRCINNEWAFVLNGDTYAEVDFVLAENQIEIYPNADGVIYCRYMSYATRYGTIRITCGRITSFDEKSYSGSGEINSGIYYLNKRSLEGFPKSFSLEEDFFKTYVSALHFYPCTITGMFIDIGVPEDYQKAQNLMQPLIKHWKLAMFDRDGTINEDTGHLFEPDKLKLIESTVETIKSYNKMSDWKVVVITNQSGIAKGFYTESDMHTLHEYLNRKRAGYGARIDAFYYCPHHPYYTGECSCRKPQPGMLLKAIDDFDADPDDCVMYGDSVKDELAAQQAGVRFCSVKA